MPEGGADENIAFLFFSSFTATVPQSTLLLLARVSSFDNEETNKKI
jgi:hypothetical protein